MDRGERLKLVIIWHMHQPIFRNGLTEEYELPWVFLHGIKDYYDMALHAVKFEGLKLTFNLTPSLLEQLNDYSSGTANCKFLRLMRKPVGSLREEEKKWLLRFFFSGSISLMLEPLKTYYRQFLNLGGYDADAEFIRRVSNQDFLNIEVLFLLSWCGPCLREKSEVISKMIRKEGVFSQDEKERLLEELEGVMAKIIPLYAELARAKRAQVTTTPYYHPILPLLLKPDCARQALPKVKLPALHIGFKDDARLQVEKAIEAYRKFFGETPSGFWPAEGGISEEALELLREAGIRWCASDESVLFNSLSYRKGTREPLYRVYSFKGNINVLFRDRELSDLVGFTYKSWKPEEAVEDFLSKLRRIHENYKNPVVVVALDGENCWEFYADNGYRFRELLYGRLTEEEWIETVFPEDLKPSERIDRIVAGSWINGNFSTWIGEEEKNRAWELLGFTKFQLEKSRHSENYPKAKEKLLIAEGSDWFWWFGRKCCFEFLEDFDRLFRSNLVKVYRLLGMRTPEELFMPISQVKKRRISLPAGYIHPTIDGEVTSYFGWLNAGKVDFLEPLTVEGSFYMKTAYYGYDEEGNLFLRIDGDWERLKGVDFYLVVELTGERKVSIPVYPLKGKLTGCEGECALHRTVEVRIPANCLEGMQGSRVGFSVKLFVEGRLVEEAPFLSHAVIDLSRSFQNEWMV
jgi:alpha-amylase/alpha-mannosidase (GH57 family)